MRRLLPIAGCEKQLRTYLSIASTMGIGRRSFFRRTRFEFMKTQTRRVPLRGEVLRGVVTKWAELLMPQDALEFVRDRLQASSPLL